MFKKMYFIFSIFKKKKYFMFSQQKLNFEGSEQFS